MKRILVVLVLVTGCSADDSATNPDVYGPPGANGMPSMQPSQASWKMPPPRPHVFEGKTAEQWGEGLNHRNLAVKTRSSQALVELGDQGYPYLLKGLQSDSEETKLLSLQSMPLKMMTDHRADLIPRLQELLRHPNVNLRRQAADRLCWFGKDSLPAVPALRAVAQNDPSPGVRFAALNTLEGITEAVTGKPVAGAPTDPTLPGN